MKRSLSTRVRKLSDAVRDAFIHATTYDPPRTRDDPACRHPHRKEGSGLRRALSHRNISKGDIRPYSRINPSSSTLDLWVGGGKVKDDVERPRTGANTPIGSRFSADTDAPSMQPQRGRNTEKKALFPMGLKKAKPVRPPRPDGEDVLSDLYGPANAEGLAPPPACAVRFYKREEEKKRKQMQMSAGPARVGEDLRHRGPNTQTGQALSRRGSTLGEKVQANDEVGPPVPPKDYVPTKMSSPFAPISPSVVPPTFQDASQLRPHDGVGADLTRDSSTRSAPAGTVGVSKPVAPRHPRPITYDERRKELGMLYATTGQVQAPGTTETFRRTPSSGFAPIQTPTRSPRRPRSRPLDISHRILARSDANEPYRGHTEFRPCEPSPLRSRQPSIAPKVAFPHQPDVYLPEAHHKRRPSEMDIPVDVLADDSEHLLAPLRPHGRPPHVIVGPPESERARDPKPVPRTSITSTRMMAKVEATVHMKDATAPRPVKMSMTITTPVAKGRPESYGDEVVIAPFSPTISLLSTEQKLIESLLVHTADPRSTKQDTYTREQLEFALAEAESVQPLSIRKKHLNRAGR